MPASTPFFHNTIRTLVSVFGDFFSNVSFERLDENNNVAQTLLVPIQYGPKQKWFKKLLANPNSGDPESTNVSMVRAPMMSYEMTGFHYDASRMLQPLQQTVYPVKLANPSTTDPDANKKYVTQYSAAPYNLDIALHIFTANEMDALAIIEQLLPRFTPNYTLRVKLNPDMNRTAAISIELAEGIEHEDHWTGTMDEPRLNTYTLNFSLRGGYLYPRTTEQSAIFHATIDSDLSITETVTPSTATPDQPFSIEETISEEPV